MLATRDGGADGARRAGDGRLPPGDRARRARAELAQRLAATEALLGEAEAALAPEAESGVATFLGAFAILLREGLEALLVVIAMIAFLRKADRPEALRYVHGGWVAALVAGAGTWVVATYAIGISGASRELTEGFGALLAALILLSVGVWMHGKAQADEWRRYIADKDAGRAVARLGLVPVRPRLPRRLSRGVRDDPVLRRAVERRAMAAPSSPARWPRRCCSRAIALAMLRLSRTLPITQFFRYSAILIAVLAVVLAGKGIGALQEAGHAAGHAARRRAAPRRCSAFSRRRKRSARSC